MIIKIINYQFDKPFLISLQLLIYLLCGIRMYMLRNLIGSYKAFKSVIFVIWFIAIFGPIQLLATHGIIPRSILIPIFFNDGDPYDYFLHPEYFKDIIKYVNGTVVECNTAYDGKRNTTDKHLKLLKEHGWEKYFKVNLLDAEGPDKVLEIKEGKVIKKNYVGKDLENYDSLLVL